MKISIHSLIRELNSPTLCCNVQRRWLSMQPRDQPVPFTAMDKLLLAAG